MVGGSDEKLVQDFIKELVETFELTSKPLEYFLGVTMNVSKDRRRIHIHQATYITEILERFGMSDCKPSVIPIDATSKNAFDGEIDLSLDYRQAIGSLMYCMLATRADISYACGFLSRYLDKPTKHLWSTAMKVFRYLKATKYYGPVFKDLGSNELLGYADADYAGCNNSRRSTSGSFIQFGSSVLHYQSRRQSAVTLSTLESELVSACETAKSCIWLARLLREAGYQVTPKLLIDNAACVRHEGSRVEGIHAELMKHVWDIGERNEIRSILRKRE